MTRSHPAITGISSILFGLALLWVVTYRPEWMQAALAGWFSFWVDTIAPLLVHHLV